MNLSDITSALSGAAPYAVAIEDLATLGIDITKAITPDAAQANDQIRTQTLEQAADLLTELVANPNADTENRVAAFDDELCLSTGYPLVGGISGGPFIRVGVQRFLQHQSAMAELRALRLLFNQLAVAGKSGQAATAVTTPPK